MVISEKQIRELEDYFKIAALPDTIVLDAGSRVDDVPRFIQSHLRVLRNNADKPAYEVFYLRLQKVKELIS